MGLEVTATHVIWIVAILTAGGIAVDQLMDVQPELRAAREAALASSSRSLETRADGAIFCYNEVTDRITVRAANRGDVEIDVRNMTFLVDGIVRLGWVAEVDGREDTFFWEPGAQAYFNLTDPVEPARVAAHTREGASFFAPKVTCPVLSTIVVTPASASMQIGQSQDFSAAGFDQFGETYDGRPYAWSSPAGAVTTLGPSSARLVAGTVAGTYLLSVTSPVEDGIVGTSSITIWPGAPASVVVTPGIAGVAAGGSASFVATVYDAYGNVNATAPVTWTTSAGSITQGGLLTAQTTAQAGRTVTAATTGGVSGQATVDVVAAAPASAAVSPASANVTAGATRAFSATLYDAFGNVNSTAPVAWSATAGSITQSGLLTAQTTAANGLGVTATSGAASASATVNVVPGAPSDIAVSPDPTTVTAGLTRAFSVVVRDAYGNVNATAPVSWSTNAGSISAAGLLTAQTTAATGRTVTATSGGVSDSATVDVWPDAPATIAITPSSATIAAGSTRSFSATIYDQHGNVNATAPLAWSTNAGAITSGGVLTAQTTAASGKTVTATSGAASSNAAITIMAAAPASVTITPSSASVTVGASASFGATLYDQYGNVNSTAAVSWTTNAGAITSGGVLTAQTTTATGKSVTATSGAASGSATIAIVAGAPTSVTVSPSTANVVAGAAQSFSATAYDSYGNVNGTAPFTWTTNAGSITQGGVLTAQTLAASGKSVTATTTGSVASSATVNVVAGPVARVALSPSIAFVNTTLTRQFTATAYDQYDNVVSGAAFTWGATRGAVSSSGLYTAPATTGADAVTATASGVTGSASVSVQRAIHVDSITTYKANASAASFRKGVDTVEARVVVRDHLGALVSGATVTVQFQRPDATVMSTGAPTSAANGTASAYYALPASATQGTWTARVAGMTGTDYYYDSAANVVTTRTFTVTS